MAAAPLTSVTTSVSTATEIASLRISLFSHSRHSSTDRCLSTRCYSMLLDAMDDDDGDIDQLLIN